MMSDYAFDEEFPEFDYLVSIEGFLVPIAHVKAVGWVETSLPEPGSGPTEPPQYFFRVYLDQPVSNADDATTRDLAAFFATPEEAEDARMELARRINEFYKRQQEAFHFGNTMH